MILFALVSSLLQLSVIHGIKQNISTGSSLRCFIYCSLTPKCEQVTKTYKSPGKWFCDFKTGQHIWTQRKNVFVESYVQISTDVYQRNALLEGMHSVVEDDSTLAAEDGSGRSSEESEDSVVEDDSTLAAEDGSGRSSEESEDSVVEDDSTLAAEDGSGRSSEESEDSVVEDGSALAAEDGSGRSSEESEDRVVKEVSKLAVIAPDTVRTITTPKPFLDTSASRKYGILRDCSVLKKQHPDALSGLYTINPGNDTPFRVYCDLTTASHAWTVIQKRRDGSVLFNRTSAEYKEGFGDLKTGFWLGNEKIRRLTEGTVSQLRFDLEDFNGIRIYAVYTPVTIADATDGYRIQIGTFFGNAGDSFRDADGQYFSTEDSDKDGKYFESCAKTYFGGWWYQDCGGSSLNGLYNGRAIFWKGWNGASIKVTEMKIRSLEKVKDCVGLPKHKGGSYIVNPDDKGPFPASCDTTTEGGNWMVIQRRTSGSENFFRTWAEYARGFGDTDGEFWIGNNILNRLTKSGHTMLRIDLENIYGQKRYAIYQNFKVASKADYYRLSIGNYSGNAGDSLRYHAGQRFSTKDKDRDSHMLVRCARKHTGAWWYNACHRSNLNGQYNTSLKTQGIVWQGLKHPITFTEMKVKQ